MKKLLAVAVLATLSTGAMSQSFKQGFYAGAELGATRVDDNAQTFANTLVANNGGSASVTQNTSVGVGRLFAGYKVTENFDLEVGYFQTGDIDYTFAARTRNNIPYSGTSSVSVNGFDYSVLIRPNISTGYNAAFLKLGGHTAKTKLETSGVNLVGGNASESGTGYLYGAGYDINVAKNMDVRLQATRLQKVSGESDNNATVFSVGILGKF
jgi:opacity protein-like surface antigen